MNLSAWARRRAEAIERIKTAAKTIIRERELPVPLLDEIGRDHRDPALRELFALEAVAHLLDMMAESMKQGRRPGRRE